MLPIGLKSLSASQPEGSEGRGRLARVAEAIVYVDVVDVHKRNSKKSTDFGGAGKKFEHHSSCGSDSSPSAQKRPKYLRARTT